MTIRRLSVAALAGQLVWLAFIVFGGLWEPGYSEIRDAVSFLGARDAAGPWVFDTVVAISGLSLFALAGALVLDAPRGLRGRLGPGLIALTGLAQILDDFPFPADCRRNIDAGCHAREVAALGAGIRSSAALLFTGKGLSGHYGLAQRLAFVSNSVWVAALALGLLDLFGSSASWEGAL